ncbi:ArsR/SmtB family transcription factor [Rhabdothermincola sediminis]|uniref:ArsR/SmtB family transcription factor n=1 Tax=Rhabdothermincola sediminis TaxID=2751370 RepID=UPI001AA08707|nr:metalloregulator ArsR/SmtB family transcription factor [Rhabdothermincola sediminis]
MSTPKSTTVDVSRRALAKRAPLDAAAAQSLTALYKVLANPNRLRLLHAIERAGELPVGEIADEVGMSMQAVSNQLQRMTDQGILVARRDGNRSYYRIVDPCVPGLLELGICLIEENQRRSH